MHLGLRDLLKTAEQQRAPLGLWALLIAVAKSDGELSATETVTIEAWVRALFPMDDSRFQALRHRTRLIEADLDDIELYGRYLLQEADPALERDILAAVHAVAWADGRPNLDRTRALMRLADVARLDAVTRRALLAPPVERAH